VTTADSVTAGSDTGAGAAAVLLAAARPDLYRRNAFRVAELPVDASPRDLARRQQLVEMAVNTEAPVPPGSGRALPLAEGTDPNAIREAMQRLRDPERRLVDELFWFWPADTGGSRQDPALTALSRDDIDAAHEIWNIRLRRSGDDYVAAHNLAVLAHVLALEWEKHGSALEPGQVAADTARRDEYWRTALMHWCEVLDQEAFWSQVTARIRELDDPRLTTGTARRFREALPLALLSINAQLAVDLAERDESGADRQVKLMHASDFGTEVVDEALRRAVRPVRERITTLCKAAETETNSRPELAHHTVNRLIDQTAPLLKVIDRVLAPGNATRDGAHDEVSQTGLTSLIAFGNKTEQWPITIAILDLLLPLAASESTRTRLQENLRLAEGNAEAQRLYGTCWFCKRNPPIDSAAATVPMYGDVTRTPTYNGGQFGTRVEWRTSTVNVPRCESCKAVHSGTSRGVAWGCGLGLLFAVVGFIGMAALVSAIVGEGSDSNLWLLPYVPILLGALFWVIPYRRARASGGGIEPESTKQNFPLVREKQREGWSFGTRPSA
jgi:hypothetical protein